jgi:1-acyl-sn-glycerol-3-phosphate acyltransferase
MYPNYIYPIPILLKVTAGLLLGQNRSFHLDAGEMTAAQRPPVNILGRENIPDKGPCVITFNHYNRSGFQAWWLALGVAAAVEKDMHWVVTNELTYPGKWYGFAGRPASHWVLKRLAKMYAFTGMPPMPPRPRDAAERARAVRQVLSFIKKAESPMLGLAPEGGDNPDGSICMPAPGAGRFGLLLAGCGLSFVPVGAYEADGAFCLRFGPRYELKQPGGASPKERDQQAARMIMQHIANLLPIDLRGEFD